MPTIVSIYADATLCFEFNNKLTAYSIQLTDW